MASHKIYAGASLRETRNRHGLTQRVFADRLGVSLLLPLAVVLAAGGLVAVAAGLMAGDAWVLVGAAFIIALGYGLIAPVLPQFAGSFGVSMAAAGAVISVFALARLLGAPGAGVLVDKLGSRPIYLTGLLIVAASTFFVAFAQAYWQIVALRFIAGFGSTMFTLSAQALIVRVTHPSIRGQHLHQ